MHYLWSADVSKNFSIEFINIYLISIFFSVDFARWKTLRKKCPYSVLLCSIFSCILTECGKILHISTYSVRIRENADQNNSEYRHVLVSESVGLLHIAYFVIHEPQRKNSLLCNVSVWKDWGRTFESKR